MPLLDKGLEGQTAVITGSSSGIGRAIALKLAEAGADVVLHCNNSVQQAEQVKQQIKQIGRDVILLRADLGDEGQRQDFINAVYARFQEVNIWVNNAGADILTPGNSNRTFDEKLNLLLRVDLKSTIALSRSVGSKMFQNKSGTIINMGWDQAITGMEGESGQLFGAVKAAIMAFSKSLALSLAPHVRVNCLAPGWIKTSWGENASLSWQERVVLETPLARWGSPEDVADAALFLSSKMSFYVTGQVIFVNGGAVR
ncbi:MAG: SDR family NAD(P)-dependent oxidoreductase [Planctomycetota bacterium]|nr:SDR family NAD(P)-dependent oxidoreductase [Planctomycetota bacterium]MDA1138121.1 SDR family NAD(P)-dependent oxidoreductase [Planctomycetota bacterium]